METINWVVDHLGNIVASIIIAIAGYFSPIKNIEIVMVSAIIFDFVIGLIASRKLGIGWTSAKMWRTIYKLFFAVVIVMFLFAMDKEMGVELIQTHKVVAWLITGFEIWSILENAAKISNHKIFIIIKDLMADKIKDKTGVDVKK